MSEPTKNYDADKEAQRMTSTNKKGEIENKIPDINELHRFYNDTAEKSEAIGQIISYCLDKTSNDRKVEQTAFKNCVTKAKKFNKYFTENSYNY